MQTVDKFKAAVTVAKPLIEEHLKAASASLEAAKAVSREHGIPFNTWITDQVQDTYTPDTFAKKWKGLEDEVEGDFTEFMEELLDIYMDGISSYGSGWEKSYC